MKWLWQIDERTQVTAERRLLRCVVHVNERRIFRSMRMPKAVPFALPDGREAKVTFRTDLINVQAILELEHKRWMNTDLRRPIRCVQCQAAVVPNAQYCDGCGHPAPSVADVERQRNIESAGGSLNFLAGLFVVSGVILFFVMREQASQALMKIANLDDTVALQPINGQTLTAGAVRAQLHYAQWGVLWVNFLLAAIMLGLARWAKRAPLPAFLAALGVYCSVMVLNIILDPQTLAQGVLMKIAIIGVLIKGVRSSLALREAAPNTELPKSSNQ